MGPLNLSARALEEEIQAKTQRNGELDIVISTKEEIAAEADELQRLVHGLRQDGAILQAGELAETKARAIFKDKDLLLSIALHSMVEAMKKDEGLTWALLYPNMAQVRTLGSLMNGERPTSTDEDVERLAQVGAEIFDQLLKKVVQQSVDTAAFEHPSENKQISS